MKLHDVCLALSTVPGARCVFGVVSIKTSTSESGLCDGREVRSMRFAKELACLISYLVSEK